MFARGAPRTLKGRRRQGQAPQQARAQWCLELARRAEEGPSGPVHYEVGEQADSGRHHVLVFRPGFREGDLAATLASLPMDRGATFFEFGADYSRAYLHDQPRRWRGWSRGELRE